MATAFDHLTQLPAPPTPPGTSRIILSNLAPAEYEVPSSPCGINLVLEGEEVYEVEGARLRVRPGEMLLMPPGRQVRVLLAGRTENRALCICLPAPALPNEPIVVSAGTSGLGRGLLGGSGLRTREEAAALAASVERTVSAFARRLRGQLDALPASKPATQRRLLQKLERAYGEMHGDGNAPPDLKHLAALAGMSLHHFARSFTSVYGVPPARLHQRLRVERAAQLIATRKVTAAEAAIRLGFADQASFTRAFKREMGEAPLTWAKRRSEV